jgi:hypothetical protein
MVKAKQTSEHMQTCADCVHESACKLWTCGRVLADENAARCPEFKTVRDTASYLIGKMEGEKTALSGGWIPVAPETMPPESHGTSDALLLRGVSDGYAKVFAGFTASGEWYTYADWHSEKLHPCVVVTHWMSAKNLLKEVEDNAEIH